MHDVAVVSLMLKGQAIEQVHDGKRELVPQDLIFTPAFEMHAYRFPKRGRWRTSVRTRVAQPPRTDCG